MKRTFLLQALAGAVLLLGVTVYAGRLLGAAGSAARIDLGGRHPATVPAELRRLLRGLDGELTATLFVSGRERMPSHLGRVEETARALLEEMEDAAGGRFSYRVIDPGLSGAAGARYAASRRVSPIRVRRVVDDAESQAEIWSSLVFSRQGRPRREDVLVQGIENAHLPHLARLVTARLTAGESAPQASFALSAPPGYGKFPRYLSQHGPVVEIDVDAGGFIPGDVDVLFWLEPRRVTRRHIAGLRRFLASGRTAVLAGSAYRMGYSAGEEGEVRFRVEGMGSAWERLLEPFGLEPVADLLMDRNSGPVTVSVGGVEREVDAPFHLRNLPAFRDFRPFRTPARGGLSFTAASPLRVDPRRVAAAGYQAHVAATTTEHARVRPLPEGEFGLQDLSAGLRVPKQSLMVLLTPEDPWAGQLLVLASASLFRDEILEQPGYGHAVFVRDLARTFADPERLARLRVDRGLPAGLPPLSGGARVGWRLAVAGLVPLVWVDPGPADPAGRRPSGRGPASGGPWARPRGRRGGGRDRRGLPGAARPPVGPELGPDGRRRAHAGRLGGLRPAEPGGESAGRDRPLPAVAAAPGGARRDRPAPGDPLRRRGRGGGAPSRGGPRRRGARLRGGARAAGHERDHRDPQRTGAAPGRPLGPRSPASTGTPAPTWTSSSPRP